jgi:outer membrane protein assembly factor BamB
MRRNFLMLASCAAAVTALAVVLIIALRQPPDPAPSERGPKLLWTFEAPRPGMVVGAPHVATDAVYLAAIHTRPSEMRGTLYSLDPSNGRPKWAFDNGGAMLATASTPILAGERLFVGEGLHGNFACNLYCLDARGSRPRWMFSTGDHIEGGPALADGLVIFGAGNDGIYALEEESGVPKWNFRADLHIDSTPFIANGRVYAGSGASRRFPATQVVCLDAAGGKPIWRTPVNLPAWGSPVVAGGRVFVGLGNGKLTEADASPAGALACFDANTGKELWNFPVPDAVFGRPAIAGERVVFGSRDGNLYGLTFDGKEVFRIAMGGPVMAPPEAEGGRIYAVAVTGRLICVNAADGRENWRYELSERGATPRVYAGPRVAGSRLFVPAEMMAGQTGIVSLYCFELPENAQP